MAPWTSYSKRARTVTRRDGGLPLAAMPLVGSGEGGGVGDKGGLHKELFTNLIPTAAEEGIDVAVVCFDRHARVLLFVRKVSVRLTLVSLNASLGGLFAPPTPSAA